MTPHDFVLNNLFPVPHHMLSTSRSFFIFPCMGLPNISTLLNGQTPWMPLTRLSYFTEGSYPPWAPSEPLLSLSTVLPSVEQDPLPLSHPRPTSPPGLCRPTPFCLVTPANQLLSCLPLSSILLTCAYIFFSWEIFYWFWSLSTSVSPLLSLMTTLKH